MTRCPVCSAPLGMGIPIETKSGDRYYVCSEKCEEVFRYLIPRIAQYHTDWHTIQ